jgi:hypothetical protein
MIQAMTRREYSWQHQTLHLLCIYHFMQWDISPIKKEGEHDIFENLDEYDEYKC